ncbi:unnamed protein product [Leptosia nina]|uniref:Kazal-like domain-containing protein n=1 Tax=Leptosia nina TaxID=320188 RepID=A0AAV1K3X8_9NEOP
MEHALFVVLLLQLCAAETPKAVPGWYAANLINESNYTPKPITEIFSTESPLSSNNPVFILQSTQSPITQDIVGSSTPTTWSTGSSYTQTQYPSIAAESGDIQRLQSNLPTTIPQSTFSTLQQPVNNIQSGLGNRDVASILGTLEQILQNQNSYQSTPSTVAVTPSTIQTWLPTQTTLPSQFNDFNTYSTSSPIPRDTYSSPSPYIPTFPPKTRTGNNPANGGKKRPCDTVKESTNTLKTNSTPTLLMPLPKPLLTIRLKAPRGSITNLHINPSTTTTTTKKPKTTTKKRKSSKRKNDYDTCLDSCKDKRDPICASPEGFVPIDSNALKGFPSLCHMACHNSFKKEITYEKVADGRCGRLRTRIRTVEKNKIKREDLKKAQYTVSHSGPETVVEFSSLKR